MNDSSNLALAKELRDLWNAGKEMKDEWFHVVLVECLMFPRAKQGHQQHGPRWLAAAGLTSLAFRITVCQHGASAWQKQPLCPSHEQHESSAVCQ